MAESDYILAALPHTANTHLLINAEAIGSMKRSAVFINVGRGKCVDETALTQGRGNCESSLDAASCLDRLLTVLPVLGGGVRVRS